MDLSGIEAIRRAVDSAEQAPSSTRRSLRRGVRLVAAVLASAAAAVALLALAQAAVDAELAGAAWDVVDLGR